MAGITIHRGSASGQPLDATLTALAAYNTDGLLTQTAADTFTGRTITGTSNQISVSNGNGVSGNPTLSVPANAQLSVAKLTNLTTNGIVLTSGSDGTLSAVASSYLFFAKTTLISGTAATYTTPSGVRAIFVQLVGGGGGGGGVDGVGSQAAFSPGGNGGGYAEKFITSPSATYTYTIGDGGAGGAAGANAGSTGGTTSFTDGGATNMTGPGGNGGGTMASGTAVAIQQPNTSLVIGTGGTINLNGGFGSYGIRLSATMGAGGAGGASILGIIDSRGPLAAAGTNAANFGVGGGGAGTIDATDRAGGLGGQGIIYVWEYK